MAELYERRQVTAHRAHVCHLCGRTIPVGAACISEKWRDGDRFSQVRRHIHCDALLDEYLKDGVFDEDYEYSDDEVWEWIRDRCAKICDEDMRGDCEVDPFSCGIMIASIGNINSRNAAAESVRECGG